MFTSELKAQTQSNQETQFAPQGPTKAFRFSAIGALLIGAVSYCIGLFNAEMALNEKGYYLAVILFGLYAAISVQKAIRDKAEGIETSHIYMLISWFSVASAISLLCIGLYNAELLLSEKGFFGMAYTLSLFSAITVQKNVRDVLAQKRNASQKHQQNMQQNHTVTEKVASSRTTKGSESSERIAHEAMLADA